MRTPRVNEHGLGLAELIVAMALLAILMTVVLSAVSAFQKSFRAENQSSDSTAVAASGMNEVTRVIRSATENRVVNRPNAPAFIEATANSVTLYAYMDAIVDSSSPSTDIAPVKVRFAVDLQTRELRETRWRATRTAEGYFVFTPNVELWTRVVARKIEPAGTALPRGETANAVFQYLDSTGAVIPIGRNGIAPESLSSINTVIVSLTVQADGSGQTAPVTIQNRVGLTNSGGLRVGI